MEPESIILTTVGWLISAIISKTIGEAWERYTKHVGLDKEIQSLKEELSKIQLLLEAAQSMQLPRDKVYLLQCLKEVKELAHEARDLFDELDYFRLQKEVELMNRADHDEVITTPSLRSIASKFRTLGLSHQPDSSNTCYSKTKLKLNKRSMSSRIKAVVLDLQKRYHVLDAIKVEQLQAIVNAVQPSISIPSALNRPQTTSYSHETKVFGRDKEINHIIELISDCKTCGEQLIPVVGIFGNGGVGKTTLAQLVYNHPKLEYQFDIRMWICVSTNFNDMEITRQMLEYFPGDYGRYDRHTNLNNLKNILKNNLKGKKILLILDDIWEIKNKSNWNSVLAPLSPSTETGGNMVLMTTRDPSIANMVCTTDPIFLDGLDDSNFWSLLKNCAFGNAQYELSGPLEDIGRRITERLMGYLLAAKTVGSLLKDNTDAIHWMQILESEEWKSQEGNEGIMPALRLSYEYLPPHLQQCFSYCSLFSRNHLFKAKNLISMWMAQGFINTVQDDNKRVEDTGMEYLDSLIDRGFLQSSFSFSGTPRYVMHDLMHDLARAVSSEECLVVYHSKHTNMQPNLRHLRICSAENLDIPNWIEFKKLSSLIIDPHWGVPDDSYDLKWDLAKNVRLLIMKRTTSWPYNFADFTCLRYLSLWFDYYKVVFFQPKYADFITYKC